VGGIHGNEPAGVLALRRVLAALDRDRIPLHGDFVALAGNLGALAAGERYLGRDLNRGWTRDRLAVPPADSTPEDREQRDLHAALEAALQAARGPVTFLDLHTTSAAGIPFAMVRNLPRQRDFALDFPLPVIMGLLELVDSTLLESMRTRGCTTLGVEAGKNDAPASIDHHEAVVWIALARAGLVRRADVPDLLRHRELLARARGSLPHVMAVDHRHAIAPEDGFAMEPGFGNIQRVRAGRLLARDRRGEIRAPRTCMLLLPLYQPQGDDGFFLGRELPSFRLQRRHRRHATAVGAPDARGEPR
jgi:succinylglutamate desuccinylase